MKRLLLVGLLILPACASAPSYNVACLSYEDGKIKGTTCQPCSEGATVITLEPSFCQ